MEQRGFDAVTGAFSFTGRFIARRLLAEERRVKTLTNHPQRAGAEDITAEVAPLQFADRAALVESLRGADVLYNTYWVRFRHGRVRFGDAVANSRSRARMWRRSRRGRRRRAGTSRSMRRGRTSSITARWWSRSPSPSAATRGSCTSRRATPCGLPGSSGAWLGT